MEVRRDAARREQLGEKRAVRDVHAEVRIGKPHAAEGVARRAQHLHLREDALLADDVAIPLVVFALAALRHALVAEALRDRRPLDREGERPLALRDHARERGRHLRAQRDVAVALVAEVVNLLAHLLARLARQQLVALDDAGVVGLEAGGLAGGAEGVKHAVAPHHVLGIEVPHAARWLETDFRLLVHVVPRPTPTGP